MLGHREIWVKLPAEARDYSLLHRAQTDSGARLASYPMGTRAYFPEGKAAAV
jgi:hypothetical protein